MILFLNRQLRSNNVVKELMRAQNFSGMKVRDVSFKFNAQDRFENLWQYLI